MTAYRRPHAQSTSETDPGYIPPKTLTSAEVEFHRPKMLNYLNVKRSSQMCQMAIASHL